LAKKVETYYLDLKNQLRNFSLSKTPIHFLLDSLNIPAELPEYKKNIE